MRAPANALEARVQVESWITYYNTVQRHSPLGYASPIDFENRRDNLAHAV
jgi:transposase InsO family protein